MTNDHQRPIILAHSFRQIVILNQIITLAPSHRLLSIAYYALERRRGLEVTRRKGDD